MIYCEVGEVKDTIQKFDFLLVIFLVFEHYFDTSVSLELKLKVNYAMSLVTWGD